MPRGGKREGAGRTPGAVTTRSREIANKAVSSGITPLEVMLDNMRFFHQRAGEALDKLLGGAPPAQIAKDAGQNKIEGDDSPVTLLDAMKIILGVRSLAGASARDAAPFIHARVAPVQPGKQEFKDEEQPLVARLKRYATAEAIEASAGKVVVLKPRPALTGKAKAKARKSK